MISNQKWDSIKFIEDESELPKEINQTEDYPFTFEIRKLTTVFQKHILRIIECKYELSTPNDYQSTLHAFVIIDKESKPQD